MGMGMGTGMGMKMRSGRGSESGSDHVTRDWECDLAHMKNGNIGTHMYAQHMDLFFVVLTMLSRTT